MSRLALAALLVRDYDEAISFYVGALGSRRNHAKRTEHAQESDKLHLSARAGRLW